MLVLLYWMLLYLISWRFLNRSCEETRTRGKRVLKDKENERLDHNLNLINVKDVNKRNVKGEGHLICISIEILTVNINFDGMHYFHIFMKHCCSISVFLLFLTGETPLQVACIKNNLKKVRQLLRVPGKKRLWGLCRKVWLIDDGGLSSNLRMNVHRYRCEYVWQRRLDPLTWGL